jgi:hypothetical protein
MDPAGSPRTDAAVAAPSGPPWLARAVFVGLLAWQGWMTLTLFGPDEPWQRLQGDQPIVSGRHPLHLYHGYLGARSLRERGTPCCYDPAFQAGYPKTPVFDSGSRPAELCLMLAGTTYSPAAYKLGLAACCLLVPWLLLLAARGMGLGPVAALLATALGLLVWWGRPCQRLLAAGDLDLLLASLAGVAMVGLLARFHRAPGVLAWLALAGTTALGCFGHPAFLLGLFPLLLVYSFSVAGRHRFTWLVALAAGVASGVLANSYWLFDWLEYWWLRSPPALTLPALSHRTLQTICEAPLWGDAPDRLLTGLLLGAAPLGIWRLHAVRQKVTARLLAATAGGCLLLALAGLVGESFGRAGSPKLLIPALWSAGLAATAAVSQAWCATIRRARGIWYAVALAALLAGAVGFAARDSLASMGRRCLGAEPLAVGLTQPDQAVLDAVVQHTGAEARILWEDRPGDLPTARWTALLPLLAERSFIGGLGPDVTIEHAYPGIVEQELAGRPVGAWTDRELEAFCRRYNIGWVVCWSPAVVSRFRAWSDATALGYVTGDPPGWLFRLPPRSFVLQGQARLIEANAHHIILADVVPEDGKVVLSFHYQAGLKATSPRIAVEREPDAHDPIPFIRLRLTGPVARILLTWQDP